jgi:hypothetical protein
MVKWIISFILVLTAFEVQAVEIAECYATESVALGQQFEPLTDGFMMVSNDEPPSQRLCDQLKFLDRHVSIMSLAVTAAGIACLPMPDLVSKPVSAFLMVSGFGLQVIAFTIEGTLESCDEKEQKAEIRKVLEEYLRSRGALIIDRGEGK